MSGSVVAGFPSPAEQYLEPPLDLNELLVKRPAATYFVCVEGDKQGIGNREQGTGNKSSINFKEAK